jgi:glycosyltransferase involved in cell wall biosynthesis
MLDSYPNMNVSPTNRSQRVVLAVTVPISHGHWGKLPELLLRRGVSVTMIASDLPRPTDVIPGVDYRSIPMSRAISPLKDMVALARWHNLLRDIAPGAVIAATPKAGLLAMLAALATGVRIRKYHVWGCRWDGQCGLSALLAKAGDRAACAASSEIIAVGSGVRGLLQSEEVTPREIRVLGFGGSKGVDLHRFRFRSPRSNPRGGMVIGFAGRLARDKGMEHLLPVLTRVQRGLPDARLVIAGGSDACDPETCAIIEALQASPAVKMMGEVEDMPSFFAGIDVLCFPSLREGLPNVVIEAAACGVPTVAWDVTGLPDTVIDGQTGFLVARGDIDALAGRVEEVLRDSALRSGMARVGRALVESRFASTYVQEIHADDICAALGI